MPKLFTLAQAQSLIPRVDRLLREAIALKSEFVQAERAFQSFGERIMLMGGMIVDREQFFQAKTRRQSEGERLRNAVEQLQEIGCLVKDLDTGLVDFPTLFRGQEVYLCWKLGEPSIEFWHGVDEGFRGRKTIDRDFRDHLEGDRAQ
jgi:hypothetical protein